MVTRIVWALCLALAFWLLPVQAAVVDVGSAPEWSSRLWTQAEVFEDVSNDMDAAQVAALGQGPGGFQDLEQLKNSTQLSTHPWWIKVGLINTGSSSRSLRLMISPGSMLQTVRFYTARDGVWRYDSHLQNIAVDGPAAARFHATAITLGPGQAETVLIRTTGASPSDLAPFLYSDIVFREHLSRNSLWNGVLFGGLLTLSWTALVLAIYSRNSAFWLLGALSLVTFLIEVERRGYPKLYLSTESLDWFHRSPHVLGHLSMLLFIGFLLQIARAEKIRLPLRNLLIGWGVYALALLIMAAFGDVYQATWLSRNLRPFFSLTLLAIAIIFIKRHAPTRKLMLLMAIFSLTQASLIALETRGLLPASIDAMTLGSLRLSPAVALAGLFMNLTVLAAWVAHVGIQRKDAQREVLRLQAQENERLTHEVARQTHALNKALRYADEKNRQQTQIVSYVSHDLRAPLATIAGYAKMLEQTARSEQKSHLQAIGRSVDYQMTLIEEILGYTRSELKPLSLSPEPTRLAPYLDEITQHARVLGKQQGNRFIITASSRLPMTVSMDGHRLRQALLNLLSNAAKFTRGGTIRLDLRATRRDTDWGLAFVVSDSGIGIDPYKQAGLLDALRRQAPNTSGLGLGLYITQNILRNMGAELHLDSAPGVGTAFSFEINVPATDDQTMNWSAPAMLPAQDMVHASPVTSETHNIQPQSLAGNADHRNDPIVMPPAHARTELAIMARDGHLTDIEDWLHTMATHYPLCVAYFQAIQQALARLDLLAIERLALAQPDSGQ